MPAYETAAEHPTPKQRIEAIHRTHGRLQLVIQDDRSALLNADDPPIVVPEPTDANPQYTSSAIINNIDYFGVADANGNTAAVVAITADLDRDFARRV